MEADISRIGHWTLDNTYLLPEGQSNWRTEPEIGKTAQNPLGRYPATQKVGSICWLNYPSLWYLNQSKEIYFDICFYFNSYLFCLSFGTNRIASSFETTELIAIHQLNYSLDNNFWKPTISWETPMFLLWSWSYLTTNLQLGEILEASNFKKDYPV